MVLESTAKRKFLLDNTKFIQNKAQPQFRKVIIAKGSTLNKKKSVEKIQTKRTNVPAINTRNVMPTGNVEGNQPRAIILMPLPSPIQNSENSREMVHLGFKAYMLPDHVRSTTLSQGLCEQRPIQTSAEESTVIYEEETVQDPLSPTMTHSQKVLAMYIQAF